MRVGAGPGTRPQRRLGGHLAYLGTSDTFDGAIADFAETYADQNETDYRLYAAAVAAGELTADSAHDQGQVTGQSPATSDESLMTGHRRGHQGTATPADFRGPPAVRPVAPAH